MEQLTTACDSLYKHQCVQEWSQYYEKRFDGLLHGLTGPASHVSGDPLEQVQPHVVSYVVSYFVGSGSHCIVRAVGRRKADVSWRYRSSLVFKAPTDLTLADETLKTRQH